MTVLIIDNYDSFTFNLYQLIAYISALPVEVRRNDELAFSDIEAMKPSHIVLSPGPGHPAVKRDFGVCKDVVCSAEKLACPVLGVCLGHQGIVQHSGGNVVRADKPVHGKMSEISIVADSPLFAGINSGTKVMRYHSLIAEKVSLPQDLQVLAVLSQEAETVMALQNKRRRLYGLQFHPESVGTELGKQILENFIRLC